MIYFLWLSDQMDHLVQMELYAPMESMVHMALFFSSLNGTQPADKWHHKNY